MSNNVIRSIEAKVATLRRQLAALPEAAAPPGEDEFVHVSCERLASELQSFLVESYDEYPACATAQLEDFVDTTRNELPMTEYQVDQREMVELYVENYQGLLGSRLFIELIFILSLNMVATQVHQGVIEFGSDHKRESFEGMFDTLCAALEQGKCGV